MEHHHRARPVLALMLTAALVAATIPGAAAFAEKANKEAPGTLAGDSFSAKPAAVYEKSEVVYAKLAPGGAPDAVYVVNRFDVESAGEIVDYGDYQSVQNLTDAAGIAHSGDATAFEAGRGAFFYQGDAAQRTLPWKVALAYRLDGRIVAPEELAGAAGKVSIRLNTSPDTAVDPAFYESFMLQITFTLPGGVFSGVAASEGATIAAAGKDFTVAFMVLPGQDGDFEITADVADFSLPGVQIAALPYASAIEMPDAEGMAQGMEDLSDAVGLLSEGTASLAAGAGELTGGAEGLSSGIEALGQGLSSLDGSSDALLEASAQVKDALSQVAVNMAGVDLTAVGQLGELPDALNGMADGLELLQRSVSDVEEGYGDALAALEGALAQIPDPAEGDGAALASLAALAEAQGSPGDQATVEKLMDAYGAAQAVKGTYGAVKPAFEGAEDLLASLAAGADGGGALAQQAAALRTLAGSVDTGSLSAQADGLAALVEGLSQIAGQYGQFHEGLAQYVSGLAALSENYGALEAGAGELAAGAGGLAAGTDGLVEGMGELDAETSKLPETVRTQIAEMTAGYDFPEFAPVSFMSERNKNTGSVQFVMATEAIEKPKAKKAEVQDEEPSVWDRFVALFTG